MRDTGQSYDTGNDTGEHVREPSDEEHADEPSDEFEHHWEDDCNHKSAAELAGETGGVSCTHANVLNSLVVFLAGFMLTTRLREYV